MKPRFPIESPAFATSLSTRLETQVNSVTQVESIYSHPINHLIERVNKEPPPLYIFRGIVHPSVGVFYGPAKSGKTVLAESMLMHIASGTTEFLNQPLFIPHPKVLIVGMEEFYRNRTIRNRNQIEYLNKKLGLAPSWSSNFHVVDDTFPRILHGDAHWDLLKREIDRLQPSMVVLDSLTRLSSDPIEESTVAQKLMQRLRDIAYSRGVTLIVIHHAHKIDDRLLVMSNMAGSRVIAQELDFMIGVNRLSNGTRYMKDIAYRYASEDSASVMTFTINDHQIIEVGDYYSERELLKDVEPKYLTQNDSLVLSFIMESTKEKISEAVTTSALMGKFVNSKVMSKPTLHACLDRLVESQAIHKATRGEYMISYPVKS